MEGFESVTHFLIGAHFGGGSEMLDTILEVSEIVKHFSEGSETV